MTRRFPAPVSGGIILSYRCTAECLHCMYACTPRWEGGWMSTEDLASILAQLAETIQPGPAGPDSIGVNYGLHFTGGEPFLNFDLLCRAVRIALDLFGRNVVVYQAEYFRRFMSLLPVFLRSWHNHFDGEGNFIPGFCGGVSLGDSRRLLSLVGDGIPLDDYSVLGYLIDDDFEGFAGYAAERGYRERPEGYLSKCHLCIDIRKHLSDNGDYKELKPAEFYRHLD